MLTTHQRNRLADDLTEDACRTLRGRLNMHYPNAEQDDVKAIERQVAVQLLTGLRSAPLETDTPGQYDARTLYGAVLALLSRSTVETDNEGQVLFYTGLVESDERHSNGQPRYLRDQA